MKTSIITTFIKSTLMGGFIFISTTSHAQLQPPNPGFELMDDTLAQDWSVSDFGADLSNLSHTGNNSIAVWNWYFYAEGFAVNGSLNGSWNLTKAGTPISDKPVKMTGFYLYDTTNTYSEDDSALASVMLKKYNTTTQSYDTVGYGKIHLPATGNTYVPFEININDLAPGIDPDSVVVYFQSSLNGFCSNASNGNCLYLYVDDLNFEFSPLGEDELENTDLGSVYPNPVSEQLMLDKLSKDVTLIEITDITGKTWIRQEIGSFKQVNINQLLPGAYIVNLYSESGAIQHQSIIKY